MKILLLKFMVFTLKNHGRYLEGCPATALLCCIVCMLSVLECKLLEGRICSLLASPIPECLTHNKNSGNICSRPIK